MVAHTELAPMHHEVETLATQPVHFAAANWTTVRLLEADMENSLMIHSPVSSPVAKIEVADKYEHLVERFTRTKATMGRGYAWVDMHTEKRPKPIVSMDSHTRRYRRLLHGIMPVVVDFSRAAHQDFMDFTDNAFTEDTVYVDMFWSPPRTTLPAIRQAHLDRDRNGNRRVVMSHLMTIGDSSTVNLAGSVRKATYQNIALPNSNLHEWSAETGEITRLFNTSLHMSPRLHPGARLLLRAVHYDQTF